MQVSPTNCVPCKKRPSHRNFPCGHIVCYDHYIGDYKASLTEAPRCAWCDQVVTGTQEFKRPSPTVPAPHPGDKTWSTQLTEVDWSSYDPSSIMRRGQPLPPPRRAGGFVPMSPGPEAQFRPNTGLNTYVDHMPPNYDNFADPIVRPESSMSNATFATQLPHETYTQGSMLGYTTPPNPHWAQTYQPVGPNRSANIEFARASQLNINLASAGSFDMRIGDPFIASGSGRTGTNRSGQQANNGNLQSFPDLPLEFGPHVRGGALPKNHRACPYKFGAFSPAAYIFETPPSVNGFANNGSDTAAKHCGLGTTPRAMAEMIMEGECESPFESNTSSPQPPRQPNPTFGPVRFKNRTKSRGGTTSDGEGDNTAVANQTQTHQSFRSVFDLVPLPDWFGAVEQGKYIPGLEEAFDALPITELYRMMYPSTAGVVRVRNIPYHATRAEMTAFVGRNAQILSQPEGSPYHAIHIILERETGKTMDCFIEFKTPNEAAWVVKQFAHRISAGRDPKVGDRVVEVEFSSQDELMAELFPRAKNVTWTSGKPVVDTTSRQYYQGWPAAGFQGFMHSEEYVMMSKHAEQSDRAPFASRSPTRVYESMISLLHKYPWYAVNHVTLGERRSIFDLTLGLITALVADLRRRPNKHGPLETTPGLLQELTVAALTCVGFSERQKAAIVNVLVQGNFENMADGKSVSIPLGGKHELGPVWPFQVLSKTPNADMRLVKYYAWLFREATVISEGGVSLHDRHTARMAGYDPKPMGLIKLNYGPDPTSVTLAAAGKIEMDAIEEMLSRVLHTSKKSAGVVNHFPASE